MLRHSSYFFAATLSCLAIAACGGNVVQGTGATGTGTGATSTGTGATSTGTGGLPPTGDCTTDAQCPGGTCAEITPGGWKICLVVPPPSTGCSSPKSPTDQCCTSADCPNGGACYETTSLPYCGGPAMAIYKECVTDQCTSDAACVGGGSDAPDICAPAGAYGEPMRTCFAAYCKTSADCTQKPVGYCAPVGAHCCSTPSGLGCVYPGGCRKDTDCAAGDSCQLDTTSGEGVCTNGPSPCPV
jgi:hypothetical protein